MDVNRRESVGGVYVWWDVNMCIWARAHSTEEMSAGISPNGNLLTMCANIWRQKIDKNLATMAKICHQLFADRINWHDVLVRCEQLMTDKGDLTGMTTIYGDIGECLNFHETFPAFSPKVPLFRQKLSVFTERSLNVSLKVLEVFYFPVTIRRTSRFSRSQKPPKLMNSWGIFGEYFAPTSDYLV